MTKRLPLPCRDAATTECARRASAAYEALRTDAVAATNWSAVLSLTLSGF
jgi:hypothetical protein